MLRQISNTSQNPDRLWFSSEAMDLFVWVSDEKEVVRFQLSYDKPDREKSLIWDRDHGMSHASVDTGANPGRHPSSPILQEELELDAKLMVDMLQKYRGELDHEHYEFIQAKISE